MEVDVCGQEPFPVMLLYLVTCLVTSARGSVTLSCVRSFGLYIDSRRDGRWEDDFMLILLCSVRGTEAFLLKNPIYCLCILEYRRWTL